MFYLTETVPHTVLFFCINTILSIPGPDCVCTGVGTQTWERLICMFAPPCWAGGISVRVKLRRAAAPVGQMKDLCLWAMQRHRWARASEQGRQRWRRPAFWAWKKESENDVAQSSPTLCHPMDPNLPGSSVRGIFQARVLEWVAIFFSRGSSQPSNRAWVSRIAGRRFTVWAPREAMSELQFVLPILASSSQPAYLLLSSQILLKNL